MFQTRFHEKWQTEQTAEDEGESQIWLLFPCLDALVIASFQLLSSHELWPDVLSLKNTSGDQSMLKKKKQLKICIFGRG